MTMSELSMDQHPEIGGVASGSGRTLTALFVSRVREHPRRVAYGRKRLGLWEEVSWEEFGRDVAAAVGCLRSLGLTAGDHIVTMGDARAEFVAISLAAQFLGVRSASIYPSAEPGEVAGALESLRPAVFIGEDDEDALKVLESNSPITVDRIVVLEPRGIQHTETAVTPWLVLLDDLQPPRLDELALLAADIQPDEAAYVAFSSGVGGEAVAAIVTHQNVMAAWAGTQDQLPPVDHRDRVVVDAPLAHSAGQLSGMVLPILTGCVPFFVEDVQDVTHATIEVRPTVSLSTPRRWEKGADQVVAAIANSSRLKRAVFNATLRFESHNGGMFTRGRVFTRGLSLLGGLLARRPILRMAGYAELRVCVVGWGAMSEHALSLWHRLGLEIRELYGSAEAAGVLAISTPGDRRVACFSSAIAGTELRVSPDGEILAKGPQIAERAMKGGEDAGEILDTEDWFHTGDAGEQADDGAVCVLGKKGNRLRVGAQFVHPEQLERIVRRSPYVSQAVVYQDQDKCLRVLVELELSVLPEWAKEQGVTYTSADELASRPEVQALIESEMAHANATIEQYELPLLARVDVAAAPLGPAELTPTRKVRRAYRRALTRSTSSARTGESGGSREQDRDS